MSKEHAYAYEAGYRDGSINYELEHCPACKNVADLQEALEENAKLRTFLGGGSIVTDYWKDEDGTMHVLTTDGEHTYEYMRGGLADENAKLRERIHELEMEGSDYFYRTAYAEDANRTLEAENAKLRELCADMMRFFEDEDWCTICEQACKCDAQEQYEEDCLMRAVFHDRMRKLEIEVD